MNAGHPKSVLYSYTEDVKCWEWDFLVTKVSFPAYILSRWTENSLWMPYIHYPPRVLHSVHDISAWGSSYLKGFQPFLLYSWEHGSSLHFIVSLIPDPDALHPSITKRNVPTLSKLIHFDSALNMTLARDNEVIQYCNHKRYMQC